MKAQFNQVLKKFILAFLVVLSFLFIGIGVFIFYQLPSTQTVVQYIPTLPESNLNSSNEKVQIESISSTDLNQTGQASESSQLQKSVSATQTSTVNSKDILEDILDKQKPLSNFCQSLANAKKGALSKKDLNREFDLSAQPALADPKIQAIKPILRYVFRLPQMQNFISLINESKTQLYSDENVFDKAAFYGQAILTLKEIVSHQEDVEALSDRGYFYYKLNELVATKPHLINDQRLQKFCADTETDFNNNEPLQFEQEKKNFERLLSELDVDFKMIDYDPEYKTHFKLSLSNQSILFSGGWIEEVFR